MSKKTPSQVSNSDPRTKWDTDDDWMFGVDDTYYEQHHSECVTTPTPGSLWSTLLMGALLGTTLVLFISLPISQTNDNTLGESIFGRLEHPKERNAK